MSLETKVTDAVEKLTDLEWVVAPEPKPQRDYPKQLHYAMGVRNAAALLNLRL